MQKLIEEMATTVCKAKETAILEAFAAGLHMEDIAGIKENWELEDNKIKYHCEVIPVHDFYKKEGGIG